MNEAVTPYSICRTTSVARWCARRAAASGMSRVSIRQTTALNNCPRKLSRTTSVYNTCRMYVRYPIFLSCQCFNLDLNISGRHLWLVCAFKMWEDTLLPFKLRHTVPSETSYNVISRFWSNGRQWIDSKIIYWPYQPTSCIRRPFRCRLVIRLGIFMPNETLKRITQRLLFIWCFVVLSMISLTYPGLASSGGDCTTADEPGIFEDLSQYQDWILKTMEEAHYPYMYW